MPSDGDFPRKSWVFPHGLGDLGKTMANDFVETAASQAAPAKAEQSDGKKSSGNVRIGQATGELLKRTASAVQKAHAAQVAEAPKKEPDKTEQTAASSGTEEKPAAPESKTNETKAEAKAEPAKETDEALSKISPNAEKRINELIARAKTAEERVEALQRRLDQAPIPQPVVAVTADNPLANVNDIEALKKELVSAKETKLWAQQQLNRKDLANGVRVGDHTYTEDQFRDALNNIERRIEIEIPSRAEFLAKRANADRLASESFEFLGDPSDDRNRLMQQVLAANPAMAVLPNARYLAAAAVEGQTQVNLRRALAADRQGTKPLKEGQRAPASQLASGAAVSSGTREVGNGRAQAALSAEMGKLKKSGHVTTRDVASFFRQKMENNR